MREVTDEGIVYQDEIDKQNIRNEALEDYIEDFFSETEVLEVLGWMEEAAASNTPQPISEKTMVWLKRLHACKNTNILDYYKSGMLQCWVVYYKTFGSYVYIPYYVVKQSDKNFSHDSDEYIVPVVGGKILYSQITSAALMDRRVFSGSVDSITVPANVPVWDNTCEPGGAE